MCSEKTSSAVCYQYKIAGVQGMSFGEYYSEKYSICCVMNVKELEIDMHGQLVCYITIGILQSRHAFLESAKT